MASIAKWSLSGVGIQNVITNAIMITATSSGFSSASAVYANQTNLDIYVDIEVVLGSLTPVGVFPFVQLYIAEAVDGTNYPNQSGGGAVSDQMLAASQVLATIPIGTAVAAKRVVYRKAIIPPGSFVLFIRNMLGANLNANGNATNFLPYNINLNG